MWTRLEAGEWNNLRRALGWQSSDGWEAGVVGHPLRNLEDEVDEDDFFDDEEEDLDEEDELDEDYDEFEDDLDEEDGFDDEDLEVEPDDEEEV